MKVANIVLNEYINLVTPLAVTVSVINVLVVSGDSLRDLISRSSGKPTTFVEKTNTSPVSLSSPYFSDLQLG